MSSLESSVSENSLLPWACSSPQACPTSPTPRCLLSAPSLGVAVLGGAAGSPGEVWSIYHPSPDQTRHCRLPSPGLLPPARPAGFLSPQTGLSSASAASVLPGAPQGLLLRPRPPSRLAVPRLATLARPDLEVSLAPPDRSEGTCDSSTHTPSVHTVPLPAPEHPQPYRPRTAPSPGSFEGLPPSRASRGSGRLASTRDRESNRGSGHTRWCS